MVEDNKLYHMLHSAIRTGKLLKREPPEFEDLVLEVKKCGTPTPDDVRLAVKAFESYFLYNEQPINLTTMQWCLFNVLELEIMSR